MGATTNQGVKRVLVTGASGFIGRHVVKRFEETGIPVRCATRGPITNHIGNETVIVGDLDKFRDWSAVLAGCDVIVHLAARAHRTEEGPNENAEKFYRTNVEVSVRLAEAAIEAGVRRMVFLSSIGVLGENNCKPFTEEDAPNPASEYARSKLKAEVALQDIAKNGGLELVILRPVLVYGPGNPGNLERLLRLIKTGLPLPFASIKNKRSLLNVEHLVEVIRLAVLHPDAANEVFNVADGEDLSISEIIRALADGMGKNIRLFSCPREILALSAFMLGRQRELTRIIGSLQVDVSKLQQVLSWSPIMSTKDGLSCTGRWYSQQSR